MAALAAITAPWQGLRWLSTQVGELQLRSHEVAAWSQLAQLNYAQMPNEIKTFWATFPWFDNTWIRDAVGQVLDRSQFPFIQITTLSELRLQRVNAGTFTFRNPAGNPLTMHPTTRERLAWWLRVVIANLAALPGRTPVHLTNRVFSATRHPVMDAYEWRLTNGTELTGYRFEDNATAGKENRAFITATVGQWREPIVFVDASPPALADLEILQAGKIYMDGHPRIQQGPTMRAAYAGGSCLRTAREVVARWARPELSQHESGLQKLIYRLERNLEQHPSIHAALQTTTATQLARKPWGVSSQQHLHRYQLTVGALNVRDNQGNKLRCPHSFCAEEADLTVEHIVWTCPAAQVFWRRVLQRWTAGMTAHSTDEVARFVFEPAAPALGPAPLQTLNALSTNDVLITKMVAEVWSVISHCATQQLWLIRNAAAFADSPVTLPAHTATMFATIKHQLEALRVTCSMKPESATRGRLIRALSTQLEVDQPVSPPVPRNVRLYFDGGSRGNPGTTGTGSILIERRHVAAPWEIVWWDAHFLGDSCTNNIAEHTALLRGLQEAARRYSASGTHVTVVGDSKLVIAQLQRTAKTAGHGLRHLVWNSSRHLRLLSSYDLQHTLRGGNKMADRLANWAMDHRCTSSLAPYDEALMEDLIVHLRTDSTAAWTDSTPPNRLLPHLQRKLQDAITKRPTRKRRHRIP